jgi:hypothetical protein
MSCVILVREFLLSQVRSELKPKMGSFTGVLFVVFFNSISYAVTCDELLSGSDRQMAIMAIQKGLDLFVNPSTRLPKPIMFHGTSTEVIEKSIMDGGFVGSPGIEDSELHDHWEEIGERSVIFFSKIRETLSAGTVIRIAREYSNMSGLAHFLLTQCGLGFESNKRVPAADLVRDDLSEILPYLVASRRFMEELVANFGLTRMDDWVRMGRSRGGVVLVFQNRLPRKNVIESPSTVDDHVLILDKPLSFANVSAIIPTNASAAARLELLKARLRASQ